MGTGVEPKGGEATSIPLNLPTLCSENLAGGCDISMIATNVCSSDNVYNWMHKRLLRLSVYKTIGSMELIYKSGRLA